MDFYSLLLNPAIKLIRSDHAEFVLDAFYRIFKKEEKVSLPQSRFIKQLTSIIEEQNEEDRVSGNAEYYLGIWCDEQHRFLRRYYEASGEEPLVELAPAIEKIFPWLEDIIRKEFVGTESRFLKVFQLLQEIVEWSTADPVVRLNQLHKEKLKIEEEIDRLEQGGSVETYNETQLKERFALASQDARKLIADFKEVENNFHDITRGLQQRLLAEDATKGGLVGYVLDANDSLKETDQGRSFESFWRYLLSNQMQDELKYLVSEVYQLESLGGYTSQDRFLEKIRFHLLNAGERVQRSNHRLVEQLRRLLDHKEFEEGRRVGELISEIKSRALSLDDDAPEFSNKFFELDDTPQFYSFLERPFWSEPQLPDLKTIAELARKEENLDSSSLFNTFVVDVAECYQRVFSRLASSQTLSFGDLVDEYPIRRGVGEVLCYLQLTDNIQIDIDENEISTFTIRNDFLPDGPKEYQLELPSIIFSRL